MFERADQSTEAWDRLIAELHRIWNRTQCQPQAELNAGAGMVVAQDRGFRQRLQLVLTRCGLSIVTGRCCSSELRSRQWKLVVVDQAAVDAEAIQWLVSLNEADRPLRVLLADDRQFARWCFENGVADWTYLMPFPADVMAGRMIGHLRR